MDTQLKVGYFVTKDMKGDLKNGPMPGVTPILLTSIGLMGGEVDSVQSINAGGNTGVDIRFSLPGGGSKRAIYVSGLLRNHNTIFLFIYLYYLASLYIYTYSGIDSKTNTALARAAPKRLILLKEM
jgi:hypothetical protein